MEQPHQVCEHCGQAVGPANRVVEARKQQKLVFCCQGCRGAYAVITGAGLEAFYSRRSWDETGIPQGAFEATYNDIYLDSYVRERGELREIAFIAAGIRCAACIWLIESIISKLPGVEEVAVNYGSHRGRVVFHPDKTSAARIFATVAGLGYIPRPFTLNTARLVEEEEGRSLLIRFATAAFLSVQLMGYSIALYGGYFSGMDPETRQLLQYFAGLVATPVVFFSGLPFIQGAWRSLINRSPNMDVLIALGVLAAYLYSLGAMITGGEVFFETAAMIVTLILLGRIFENGARKKAYSSIDKLLQLAPDTARLLRDKETVVVTSSDLHPGDIILIAPGERLPVDGVLLDEAAEIDESVLTGEAEPVIRRTNEQLLSGSLNLTRSIKVRVTRAADSSFMARIGMMIEEAQNRKAPVQSVADRAAVVFVPTVIFLAAATFIFWNLHGSGPVTAFLYAIAVLVVACPCALGLATPTAIIVSSGTAAGEGILFRGGDTLEAAARLTMAAFDKTGTLTEAFPRVVHIEAENGDDRELLSLAARIESGSTHPLARGILARAKDEGIPIVGSGSVITPGRGVKLDTGSDILLAGNRSFMGEYDITLPDHSGPTGLTEVHVAENGSYRGCIFLDSQLRPGARQAVRQVAGLGLQTFLLTGDNLSSARKIAAQVGISQIMAEQSPARKKAWINQQQQRNEQVLMVGDGINDGPALSAAAVGCALGGGTDIALETSDLVLMHDDILQLPRAILLARKTLRIIRQNLFWAFTYNLVAIPLAATGNLAPVYAAAAMAFSSVCVVANSLRLRTASTGTAQANLRTLSSEVEKYV